MENDHMKTKFLASLATAALLSLAPASANAADTYKLDPTHTTVIWSAEHFGFSTPHGLFPLIEGTLVLDEAAPENSKIDVTIPLDKLATGIPKFDEHLKSKDFFNAEAFPTAHFVGDKFTFEGDKVTAVSGTLTLLGKSQPVEFKADNFNCYQNPMLKREVCGGDFEGVITRSAFGMNYGLPFIPDSVKLVIQVEAVKQ